MGWCLDFNWASFGSFCRLRLCPWQSLWWNDDACCKHWWTKPNLAHRGESASAQSWRIWWRRRSKYYCCSLAHEQKTCVFVSFIYTDSWLTQPYVDCEGWSRCSRRDQHMCDSAFVVIKSNYFVLRCVIYVMFSGKLLEGRLHEFDLPMLPVSHVTAPSGSSAPLGKWWPFVVCTRPFLIFWAGSLKLKLTLKFPLVSTQNSWDKKISCNTKRLCLHERFFPSMKIIGSISKLVIDGVLLYVFYSKAACHGFPVSSYVLVHSRP